MKAYELMSLLAGLTCDTEIIVSGLVTIQEIANGQYAGCDENDNPMYEFYRKIIDGEFKDKVFYLEF